MSAVSLPSPLKTFGLTTKSLSVTLVQIGPTNIRIHFAKLDAGGAVIGTDTRTTELEPVRSILEAAGKHEDKLAALLAKTIEAEIALNAKAKP